MDINILKQQKESIKSYLPVLLNIKQVCQLLNISRAKFYKLKAAGKIGPNPVGICRKVLYRKEEIENWIKLGFPDNSQWSINMEKEKTKNNLNIVIHNFNGVLGNIQTENMNKLIKNNDYNNYKKNNNKHIFKKSKFLRLLFTYVKKVIRIIRLIKSLF